MKKTRFSEEQIIAVLREQEGGMKTADVCRKHARSVLRLWRDDYNHVRPHSGIGGLTPADAARRVVQHRPEGHHTNLGLQL